MRVAVAFTFLLSLSTLGRAEDRISLPEFNVDKSSITVSGISSGACFATQFHVAYSSVVSGMGSWAGIVNLCYDHWNLMCLTVPSMINVGKLTDDTDDLASSSDVDDTSNLASAK